jgi:hypothetical protein
MCEILDVNDKRHVKILLWRIKLSFGRNKQAIFWTLYTWGIFFIMAVMFRILISKEVIIEDGANL